MEDQATVTTTTATAAFDDDNDTHTRVAVNTSTADVDARGAIDAETDMTLTSTSGDSTEEEMKREVNARLSHLMADFQRSVTDAMTSLTERYHSEKRAHIATEQTAVLRVNKVMRDLARSLGPLWRQVTSLNFNSFCQQFAKLVKLCTYTDLITLRIWMKYHKASFKNP